MVYSENVEKVSNQILIKSTYIVFVVKQKGLFDRIIGSSPVGSVLA